MTVRMSRKLSLCLERVYSKDSFASELDGCNGHLTSSVLHASSKPLEKWRVAKRNEERHGSTLWTLVRRKLNSQAIGVMTNASHRHAEEGTRGLAGRDLDNSCSEREQAITFV